MLWIGNVTLYLMTFFKYYQKANLAYSMVRCAAIKPGMTIADPFCGSGTLLLEALEICNKKLKCIGLDVSRRTVDGARDNAVAEGYDGSEICEFICSDARGLRRHLTDNSIDAIVTNLPWGIKTGHNSGISDLQTIYEIFLRTAWYALKDGARVVLFVLRGLQMTRIVRKLGGRYRLLSVNVIRTSNNLPCIVVIEKLAVDVVRDSVKGQLAHLNKYVSFSPELYEAIHMETIDD
jgi:23S rRNA G2445 N2-methylase RlmL